MIGRLATLNRVELGRFAWAFVSRFGSTFLSFAVLFIASHLLPTYEYGLYVFLFSIGSALGLIAVLGQQILVVKHYRRDAPQAPENQALIGFNARWLAGGVGLLLAAALALWIARALLPAPYDALYLACLFAAVFALSEYLQNVFRIHGRIMMSLLPREIVWRAGSVALLVVAGAAGILANGAEAIAILIGLLVATTAYQVHHFVRAEGLGWLSEPAGGGDRGWRAESGYFLANGVLNASSSYLETIVIGAVLGLEQAAFYFVALRFAMLLTLPVAAIDTVGIPMIAARFQASDRDGAQRLIGRLSLASFLISLAGAGALALVGRFALGLFDDTFVAHFDVLMVLSGLAVSQAFFGPGSWLLMIGGGERFFLLSRAVLFVAYLGLLYGLASLFGLVGIAAASVLFNVGSNLAATYWIMNRWGIDNMATAFFRPVLPGGRRTGAATTAAATIGTPAGAAP